MSCEGKEGSGCSLGVQGVVGRASSRANADTSHFDMDFSNVDIEEVGFDRPCTKDVHGSLGSLDIQLCAVRLDPEIGSNLHCRSSGFLAHLLGAFIALLRLS